MSPREKAVRKTEEEGSARRRGIPVAEASVVVEKGSGVGVKEIVEERSRVALAFGRGQRLKLRKKVVVVVRNGTEVLNARFGLPWERAGEKEPPVGVGRGVKKGDVVTEGGKNGNDEGRSP